jgi:hypothetical protein
VLVGETPATTTLEQVFKEARWLVLKHVYLLDYPWLEQISEEKFEEKAQKEGGNHRYRTTTCGKRDTANTRAG